MCLSSFRKVREIANASEAVALDLGIFPLHFAFEFEGKKYKEIATFKTQDL